MPPMPLVPATISGSLAFVFEVQVIVLSGNLGPTDRFELRVAKLLYEKRFPVWGVCDKPLPRAPRIVQRLTNTAKYAFTCL